MNHLNLQFKFLGKANQRYHDLRVNLYPTVLNGDGSLNNSLGLHLRNFRVRNSQTATAMTEHRIEFVKIFHAFFYRGKSDAKLLGKISLGCLVMWQELMQGRIKQTNCGRTTLQCFKDSGEILALKGEKLFQCRSSILFVIRQNHLAHRINPIALEEHMLRAAKTNSAGSESNGIGNLRGRIRIRPDALLCGLLAPVHQLGEILIIATFLRIQFFVYQYLNNFRRSGFQLTTKYFTSGTIDRHKISLFEGFLTHLNSTGVVIDLKFRSTTNTYLTHLTGNQCSMRGHPSSGG